MNGVEVTWKPDDQVIRTVVAAGRIREQMAELADLIVKDAQMLCPVDTGALRRTIRHGGVSGNGQVTFRAGGVEGVDYAAHVEYGIGRGPAQPFLRPAIHKNRGVI